MVATPVALGHGAAAFCLPGMAALASLANSAARRMRSDSMDGEGVVGGRDDSGAIRIHDAGGGTV